MSFPRMQSLQIDIKPGESKNISMDQNTLLGIRVLPKNAYLKLISPQRGMVLLHNEQIKRFVENSYFIHMNTIQQELDIAQHQAFANPHFPITYALKSGWTMYYVELIPQ